MIIPEADLLSLRMFCRLGEDDQVPAEVESLYWRFKHTRDFGGASPIHPDVLAWIVFQAAPQPEPPPKPFCPKDAGLQEGDTVIVKWRGQDAFAKFLEITPRQSVRVLIEGEPIDREVPANTVLGIAQEA